MLVPPYLGFTPAGGLAGTADLFRVIYVVAFGLAGLACLVSVRRALRFEAPDTRLGLVGLLVFSGLWAGAHVGRLLASTASVAVTFYTIGLVFGLGTVGAWLYFSSAYTGHDYHREPSIRRTAVGVYALVVTAKLTNPLHQEYFTASFLPASFPRLVIDLGTLHWIVLGLAYALAAVGFYLLYEMFRESNFETTRVAVPVALAAAPAALDAASYLAPGLLVQLSYEPIGVALFALGALYAVDEQFVAMPRFWREHVIEELDEIVVLVDREGVIRDANAAAAETFRAIGAGERLGDVAPDLARAVDESEEVFTVTVDDETRHYVVTSKPLSKRAGDVGRAIICADVTRVERQRRELKRQNEQFDDFAAALTHELRNAINVIEGHLDLATRRSVGHTPGTTAQVADASEVIDHVSRIVDDLSTVLRYSRTVDDPSEVRFRDAATAAWSREAHPEASLVVESDGTIIADPPRLEELLRHAFAFATANGATTVTTRLTEEGFTVTGDGEPIPPDMAENAFEYDWSVPSTDSGVSLPNVRTLARVLGWSAGIDAEYGDGVRVRISNVTVEDGPRTRHRSRPDGGTRNDASSTGETAPDWGPVRAR